MSFANPANQIPRQPIPDNEINEWVKMWDPPTASPATPELVDIANRGNDSTVTPLGNPVPEVMAAAGFQTAPATPHTIVRNLMHGSTIQTWDGLKRLTFFEFMDPDNPTASGGTFPGAMVRVPRGSLFHSDTVGAGPPPHTIHWHGIEPTPINDGVGHCSMEVGSYTYQWQPNFIGSYFFHCHRNTVQHFEFGLYGFMPIMPSDAYWASIDNIAGNTVTLNTIPIGHGRPEPGFPLGRFRTAANLSAFPQIPGWVGGLLTDPDPEFNNSALKSWQRFQTNPHAQTVPYDVEAIWVVDDRDSRWSDLAPSPFATFPRHGNQPGVNDQFHQNPGSQGFFAFNDFHADYWFVTGVPVPAHLGETGTIAPGLTLPPALNGGITGTQVSIEAQVGQTILVRCLDAAYNSIEVTFPVDVVIIAWDGRALGVPPYGMNEAYRVPANTPIVSSTARRFDALIRATAPISDFATVKFIDTRSQATPADPGPAGLGPGVSETVVMTTRIPINISAAPAGAFSISGTITPAQAGVTVAVTGAVIQSVAVDAATGAFTVSGLNAGSYTLSPSKAGVTFGPSPSLNVTITTVSVTGQNFTAAAAPAGTFRITGPVLLKHTGGPVVGVQINLIGPTSGIAVTDAAGKYIFSGLANGRYTLVPSAAGFRFFPHERTVNISGADQIGMFFEAE